MAEAPESKSTPFLFNPLELLVFAVVLGIFSYSGYQLVYDWKESRYDYERNPAQISVSQPHVTFGCATGVEERGTHHREIRLSGPICTESGIYVPDQFISAEVTNTTLRKSATVFTDVSRGELSTDYLPLAAGDNVIQIQFRYKDREPLLHKIRIARNSESDSVR